MAISRPFFQSYRDAQQYFSHARSPAAGRPVRSFGRLFLDDDNTRYRLEVHGVPCFYIHPDNTIEFPFDVGHYRRIQNTLSYGLAQITPFAWVRLATHRYAIAYLHNRTYYDDTVRYSRYPSQKLIRANAPEVNNGIKFDIGTGACVEGYFKPSKSTANTDKQTEWRKLARSFRQGFKVRARIGVFDSTLSNIAASNFRNYSSLRLGTSEEINIVGGCVVNQLYTDQLLLVLYGRRMHYVRRPYTAAEAVNDLENFFKSHSMLLRKWYGVFDTAEDASNVDE